MNLRTCVVALALASMVACATSDTTPEPAPKPSTRAGCNDRCNAELALACHASQAGFLQGCFDQCTSGSDGALFFGVSALPASQCAAADDAFQRCVAKTATCDTGIEVGLLPPPVCTAEWDAYESCQNPSSGGEAGVAPVDAGGG